MLYYTQMNERTAHILDLVTAHYITSAKPVASAPIAKQLGVSSATVRSEFAALEEAGYLAQPHTSAGRVPTAESYRRYARKFIPPKRLPKLQRDLLKMRLKGAHGDTLLQQVANVTAELSGYAVVVSLPADDDLHTLEIHLSALSSTRLLAVVVLENGLIRQLVLDLAPTPSDDALREAERGLRSLDVPVQEVPVALVNIATRAEEEVARTFRALADAWPTMNPPRLFSQGLKNLLTEPESTDPEFVRMVVERVEQPNTDADIDEALRIVLEETVALVSARLELGSSKAGLMLLGPLRMRYPETLAIAQGVTETVAKRAEQQASFN